MVGELAFNYDAKPTKLEQDIGTMCAVNVDSLAISSDAVTGDQNSELRVDCFFSIPLLGHSPYFHRYIAALSCPLPPPANVRSDALSVRRYPCIAVNMPRILPLYSAPRKALISKSAADGARNKIIWNRKSHRDALHFREKQVDKTPTAGRPAIIGCLYSK